MGTEIMPHNLLESEKIVLRPHKKITMKEEQNKLVVRKILTL